MRPSLVSASNVTLRRCQKTLLQTSLLNTRWKLSNGGKLYITGASSLQKSTHLCHIKGAHILTTEISMQQQIIYNSKTFQHFQNGFKTSSPKRVHPLLMILIKPLSRLIPMIAGRKLRKWWKSLSDAEKITFKETKKKYGYIVGAVGLVTIASILYANQSHDEDWNVLGTKVIGNRFIALSKNQMKSLGTFEFEQMLVEYEDNLLPDSDPTYGRVAKVANRLLEANVDVKGIHGKTWTISVVRNEEQNAFVLPNGNIFVFTGMLEACKNDDQLGIVLGHEIAHVLLSHGAEQIAYSNLLSFLMIAPFLLLWAVLPNDAISMFASWLFSKTSNLLLELPFSRKMENEADVVGLELSSKACFDVREAPAFWGKMKIIEDMISEDEEEFSSEFLSTHPSHANRQNQLSDLLPNALERRSACDCKKLLGPDPMQEFMDFKNYVNAYWDKQSQEFKSSKEVLQTSVDEYAREWMSIKQFVAQAKNNNRKI